ncbi:transposase [Limnoglobus roseus]|uniref:Transposase InsH N-terminal domain-containing protein n=1 Tax=Limnoglobus roseus TaxID=2598579 RepID=A0A5C1AHI0_9BACT|nr:transposase [Limnoglobus roseus]QEL16428.1 hypothetical protein PX52LOC_03382 [Limnoglobus roseus]
MRGRPGGPWPLFHVFDVEAGIPADHPLRGVERRVDRAPAGMPAASTAASRRIGRPGVPPEGLLKALLVMARYSARRDRQLCARIDTDLLFRGFLDPQAGDDAFDATTFTRNRQRLDHHLTRAFFAAVVREALAAGPCREHFRVDGTRIERFASAKGFQPGTAAGGGTSDPGGRRPRGPAVDAHGRKRTNAPHASRTDPEARRYRKGLGEEAGVAHMGHTLATTATAGSWRFSADGTAERVAALERLDGLKDTHGLPPTPLGADEGFDSGEFFQAREGGGSSRTSHWSSRPAIRRWWRTFVRCRAWKPGTGRRCGWAPRAIGSAGRAARRSRKGSVGSSRSPAGAWWSADGSSSRYLRSGPRRTTWCGCGRSQRHNGGPPPRNG